MLNALTIDLEEWFCVSNFENAIHREQWSNMESRIETSTQELLDLFQRHHVKATFFVLGWVAEHHPKMIKKIIVHVEGTVRPQTVSQESNPLFHELISNLGKRTGHPVVLNTSFNVRGEPIVCTPLDALKCFYSSGLDALIIGNFLLQK